MTKQPNGPARSGTGPGEDDLTGGAIYPGNNARLSRCQRRLELFGIRCRQMVERVNSGAVPFILAVDCLYEAAIWSGLADDVGDDIVQRVMADAFRQARRP